MLRKALMLAAAATVLSLLTSASAQAWGAYHVGYTHVGYGGVYHYGRTYAGGYGGYDRYRYGGAYHYGGYGGYDRYRYGGLYHYGGYGGLRYGDAYRAGFYRRW
jgi:hypothetical protein